MLVDLHARGMREPLPLYCNTSAAYAAAPSGGRSVRARKEWTTPPGGFDREDRDAAHVLVLGDDVPFDDLERAGTGARRSAAPDGTTTSRAGSGATPCACGRRCSPLEQRSGL